MFGKRIMCSLFSLCVFVCVKESCEGVCRWLNVILCNR